MDKTVNPNFGSRGEVKAILVERRDKPGALGVYLQGCPRAVALPSGYDGQTSLTVHKGYVLVAHPSLPPLECDMTTGTLKLIEPGHIEAKPGRMRLRTH